MYFEIYNLILEWLYSGGEVTSEIEMVCTFLSTLSTIAVFVVPFVIVFFVIRFICNIGR